MLERAKPTQARKSLELANVFVKSGVRFVPMPCADDAEYDALVDQCIARLNAMEAAAEAPPSQPLIGEGATLTRCAAARDGECRHAQCPQLRDGEPSKSGRHCPLDNDNNED